jgi:hypothetical protein
MANLTPTPKVAAAGISGAITVLLIWIAGLTGVPLTPEVASAITLLIMSASAWLKKDNADA